MSCGRCLRSGTRVSPPCAIPWPSPSMASTRGVTPASPEVTRSRCCRPSPGAEEMFAIVEGPIDVAALISAALRPDCGAVSTFAGTTRVDESEGASVEYLEYEAYRPMADRKLEEIGAEIEDRWDVREVSIVHRVGRVDPGEASV